MPLPPGRMPLSCDTEQADSYLAHIDAVLHALTDAFALPFSRIALVVSLVLAGIHAYLGFHIVRRGVLFVDLALAQVAALGVAIALAMDLEHHPVASYMLALGMTFVGAALFAWLRGRARARFRWRRSSGSCSPPRRRRCS